MIVTVDQQIFSDLSIRGSQVKRNAISFRIPIGGTAVFFAGKTFRADIQPCILTSIGLVKLENVEPDCLLSRDIAFNHDVATLPLFSPGLSLLLKQGIKTFSGNLIDYFFTILQKVLFGMILRRNICGIFINAYGLPGCYRKLYFQRTVFFPF